MRITRPQMFMEIAQVVAKRSTCMRLNVGAVIVKDRSIVSIGYNGSLAGHDHCAGNSCPGKHGCNETIHAEDNALRHLPPGLCGPMDLYVTDSPCHHCFHLIRNDGRIRRIFFMPPYRITAHFDGDHDIEIYRVTPAGYVMDWRTKELVDAAT